MDNNMPVKLVECSKMGKIFGLKIDMKLIIIVVVLLLLFFLVVFPMLKSKKEHQNGEGIVSKAANMIFRRETFSPKVEHIESPTLNNMVKALTEKFSPITEKMNITGALDVLAGSVMGQPVQTFVNKEHLDPVEEMYNNLMTYTDIELRNYIASLDDTSKKTIITTLGTEKVARLNEKMGGNILVVREGMSDYVKGNEMSSTGSLSPVPSNEIDSHKIENMMCSKSCCSPQWGVKPELDDRIQPNDLGTKFMPTNYMCSGENPGDQGNGCVCVEKDTFSYLGNRGGNNIEE